MVPEGERGDRFRIAVSILIALVAVTGALISWKISRVNDRASSFDSDAIKAALAEAVFLLTLSLTLKLGAGQGLSAGRYLVELYVQGNLLSLEEFEIR